MARWQSYAALIALAGINARSASKHKRARALRFAFRHRGAHRKVCARIVLEQQRHAARCDEAFEVAALKRARAVPATPSFTEPLKWTRRGKRIERQKSRRGRK